MTREELLFYIEDLTEELNTSNKNRLIDIYDEITELIEQLDQEGKIELIDSLQYSSSIFKEDLIELCR